MIENNRKEGKLFNKAVEERADDGYLKYYHYGMKKLGEHYSNNKPSI